MRAIKQDDVIDVIYDSWYGLPLDEADKVIRDYAHRKLIPIEWIWNKWLRRKKQRWVDTDAFADLINDWQKEKTTD